MVWLHAITYLFIAPNFNFTKMQKKYQKIYFNFSIFQLLDDSIRVCSSVEVVFKNNLLLFKFSIIILKLKKN
jgi:hypothetical protein